MKLAQRKKAFAELGRLLTSYENEVIGSNDDFQETIKTVHHYNGWFTEENVRNALSSIGKQLNEENLNQWLSKYDIPEETEPLKVGIVMAGNIPMVGFHDLLSILITGNIAVVKFSSDDDQLIPKVLEMLYKIEPEFEGFFEKAEGKLENFDAIIATGSNNTSRYFDYYFGKYPSIIRKNRNSVAIISGSESRDELTQIGKDIFRYFGLGCRSVSKLYIPKGYDIPQFLDALSIYEDVANHKKYGNNYDYNKTLLLLNNTAHLDTGFLLLKEDKALASPVSLLHYEFYEDGDKLRDELKKQADQIQCVVSESSRKDELDFGQTQEPELWDYADNVDTISFIMEQQMAKTQN